MHEILEDGVTDSGVLGIITHTRKARPNRCADHTSEVTFS
jgi:hypothetical protein